MLIESCNKNLEDTLKKITMLCLVVLLNIYFDSGNVFAATQALQASPVEAQPTGTTSTNLQTSIQQANTLVDTKNTLMALTTNATAPVLSAASKLLFGVIQGNAASRNDMNLLYGNEFPSLGSPTAAGISLLNGIVKGVGYNQSVWLSKMQKTASLLRALQADAGYRAGFNSKYAATTVPVSGTPKQETRWELFAIVGTTGYTQTNFLNALPKVVASTLSSAAKTLFGVIQSNSGYRNDMNLLYGNFFPSSGNPTAEGASALNTIVSGGGYSQSTWLSKMQNAASLLRALQANSTYRTKFNSTYTVAVPTSGTPPQETRWALFAAVGTANYNQTNFLNSLAGGVAPPPPAPGPAPIVTGSGLLGGSNSFWNQKLSGPALDSNSAGLVNELVANTKLAPTWINTTEYTTPLYYVDSNTQKVPLRIIQNGTLLSDTRLDELTRLGVPLPPAVKASNGTDGEITIYDKSTDTLYEFWQFKNVNGQWQASWGGVLKNASTSNGIMPVMINKWGNKEYWGATATNLPAMGGTILLEDLKAGVIDHVLGIGIIRPKAGAFKWPAMRTDGFYNGPNAIMEGQRFRFASDVYIDPNWPPIMKMMVIAIRDYGMVVRDKSDSVGFSAEDPAQYGMGENAYTPYYGGKQLWDVMALFPWSKLQALA